MSKDYRLFFFRVIVSTLILNLSGCSLVMLEFSEGNDDYDEIEDPDYTVQLPIGINLTDISASTEEYAFNDVMTTASTFKTFIDSEWDTNQISELDVDDDGYPTSLPQTVDGDDICVRFLVNDNYPAGRYRILYDGTGTLYSSQSYLGSEDIGGETYYYLDLTGNGNNVWVDIKESDPDGTGDYINNMHIISEDYGVYTNDEWYTLISAGGYETFHEDFLEGLEEFNCLRFMDWGGINNSDDVYWDQTEKDSYSDEDEDNEVRKTSTYYTQSGRIAYEYAIELCNELGMDAWLCVPHRATDNYITELAELWEAGLDTDLKVYLEYSNELWNFNFEQTIWVADNASDPEAVDSYVSDDLDTIAVEGDYYGRKNAYMMGRLFRLWDDVFGSSSDRIVKLATGQQGWAAYSGTVLQHVIDLELPDSSRGTLTYTYDNGCDALAVGGYFYFSNENHEDWVDEGDDLTFTQIYYDTYQYLTETTSDWTRDCAAYANEYGVDYLVYEGGQHMQPKDQDEWSYNQRLYDFQIDSRMYDLYFHAFNLHVEDEVDCQLFMAYNYVSERETKWGSWGHLESLSQLGSASYYDDAPKYQALLDVNINN
ncbi:MAG: hypothetical protein PQJ60_09445 [Spirochaetales bacterium]|nr:hypothetical protein [Spirochaetales bacterium]